MKNFNGFIKIMDKNLSSQLTISSEINTLTLCISPCRSSSTAMLRVFSNAGCLSIFQPIKNIIRWNMFDINFPFEIPSTYLGKNFNNIFIKETLGPYADKEIYYKPEEILLSKLYNEKILRVLVLIRDPFSTWWSWKTKLEGKTNIELFINSYKHTYNSYIFNKKLNKFPVIPFSYNLLKVYEPKKLMNLLLNSSFLYKKAIKEDYSYFDNDSNNLFWPKEPLLFKATELHKSVLEAKNYKYQETTFKLPDDEKKFLIKEGLTEMFEEFEKESINYFQL